MAGSRYPCRVCDRSTEGVDSYTVCPDCLADVERRSAEQFGHPGEAHQILPAGCQQVPLAPDEVEARLRKLLDSW